MKLQFDANLHYQEQAVSAVVDLFRGQTPRQSNFTVSNYSDQGTMFTDNGVGNKLELVEDEILENLQAVQLRNGLPQTKALKKGAYSGEPQLCQHSNSAAGRFHCLFGNREVRTGLSGF